MSLEINFSYYLKTALLFSLLIGFGSVISIINPLISDGITTIVALMLLIINKEFNVNKNLLYCIFYIFFSSTLSAILTRSNIFDYFGIYFRTVIVFIIFTAFKNNYEDIKRHLIKALWIVTYLAIFNFILIHLIPSAFNLIVSDRTGFKVDTLGFFFNYYSTINIQGFEINRNQSIFWEPGVLQIPMNILVYFLLIEQKKKIASALLPMFIILTTFSTTGFIILIYTLIRTYWIGFALRGKGFLKHLGIFAFLIMFLSFLVPIIVSKFSGEEHKTSAIARQYDILISALVIKENPIIGIGINEENYFKEIRNKYVDLDDFFGSEEHGNTNTVVSVVIKFGIPLAIVFFYFLYHQNLFENKRDFFIIIILSLISEPLLVVHFVILLLMSSVKFNKVRI